jgi:hypothetical protein
VFAPVSAREEGPRFANDRLDAIVTQHREASRFIASKTADAKSHESRAHAVVEAR